MATTDVLRTSKNKGSTRNDKGSPAGVRLGVQWGYPFSLVRRLFLGFVCLLALCFLGAYVLTQPADPVDILVHLVPAALAILLSMYVVEVVGVTERPLPPLGTEALFTAIGTACLVMAVGYALLPTYAPSTTLLCAAPVAAALGAFLQRKWKDARGEDEIVPAALFARDRADAVHSLAELADAPGVAVRTLILPDAETDRAPIAGLQAISPRQVLAHVREQRIELFVVGRVSRADLRPILPACAGAGSIVERVDDLVAAVHGRVNLTDRGGDVDLLNRLTRNANRFGAQRAIDTLATLALMPVALPIGLLVALAVKLSSKGPVFFAQVRVGLWGKEFKICKFRTMRVDAEKESGPVWAQENDPRITRIGRFLRATRLDELPQLWNVLRGDMSLVGPRPERPFFVRSLREKIPLYDARHSVRPGVTGWAQIRWAYGATDEDARVKLGYELFYILNRSGTFYFACVLETLKVLLFRRGAR